VLPPEAGERVANKPTNLLLASLSAADLKLLEPHLRPFEFPQHKVLFEAGDPVSGCYFPYDAVVSLVVTLSTGEMIEAAMVGRDGIFGSQGPASAVRKIDPKTGQVVAIIDAH